MFACEYEGCSSEGIYPISSREGERIIKRRYCERHALEVKANLRPKAAARDVGDVIEKAFGRRYREASFDNFRTDDAFFKDLGYERRHIESIRRAYEETKAFAEEVIRTRRGSLMLYGMEGTGKTHLLVAFARRLVESGLTISAWSAMQLTTAIRQTYSMRYSDQQNTVQGIIERMLRADAVFIEDVVPSCFARDIRDYLFEIVNGIYTQRDKVIGVTTNFTADELREEERLGPHLIDRLLEPPSCIRPIQAPSLRVAIREKSIQ